MKVKPKLLALSLTILVQINECLLIGIPHVPHRLTGTVHCSNLETCFIADESDIKVGFELT